MRALFILLGISTLQGLQACNQTKSVQKEATTPVEYRRILNNEISTNKNGELKKSTEKVTPSTEREDNIPTKEDTILNHIQEKITAAWSEGFAKKSTQKLNEIENLLTNKKSENENLKNYWIAYINYYKTIMAILFKNENLGKESNKKGIEILERNRNKNSDDYALLVLLKGMSFPFSSGIEALSISRDINKLIEKGIETDSTNFRVYYAKGSVDFYTPKEYGGGTKAEEALLKAINLPEKNIGNSQLPTWGKEEAYDLIIRLYLREGKKEKAKIYFDKAKQLFPNSRTLQTHQPNFKS
ncbi:MAG: hypothetical protein FDW93_01115 [Bergeyella sp.]|nr:hypothetical protein [Bergeyella sp.]